MSPGWPRAGIAAIAAAVAVSGCSTGVDRGDRAHARSAGQVFLNLCAETKGSDLAALVTGPALDRMMKSGDVLRGCAAVLRIPRTLSATTYARARVTDVTTNGGEAELKVSVPGVASGGSLEVERHGDRWEITNSRFSG